MTTRTKISKSESAKMITKGKNRLLVVTYTKKNDELRTITCRQRPIVQEGVPTPPKEKQAKKKANSLGYALVWDVSKNNWRHINLQTVTFIESGKGSFVVN